MTDSELLPNRDEIAAFSKTPLGVDAEVDKQRLLRMQQVMQRLEALPPEEQEAQLAEALAAWELAALTVPAAGAAQDAGHVRKRHLAMLAELGPVLAPEEKVARKEPEQVAAHEPATTKAAAGSMPRPAIADVPAPPEPPLTPETKRGPDPPPAQPEVMPPSVQPEAMPPPARPDVMPPSRVPKSGALGFMLLGDTPLCSLATPGQATASAQPPSESHDPVPVPPPDAAPLESASGPETLSRMPDHMPIVEEETVFDPALASPRDTLPGSEGLAVAARLVELPFRRIDDEVTVVADPRRRAAARENHALPFRAPTGPSTDAPANSSTDTPATTLSETLEEGLAPASPLTERAAHARRQLVASAEHYAALCALRDQYEHWLEAAFTRLGATTPAAHAQCDATWRERLMDDRELLKRFQQAYERERRRLGGAPEA